MTGASGVLLLLWGALSPSFNAGTLAPAGGGLVAAGALLKLLSHRRILHKLQRRISDAQEGLLEPLLLPRGDAFLRSLVQDYNLMITTLRTMFSTVEECQARALVERNTINAILQSLPGALLSVADDLRISGTNKNAEELFQREKKQLIGTNLFDILLMGERDREVLRDAFLYKHPKRNQEIGLELRGATRVVSLNLAFVSEMESDMAAVLTLQDITEYRQLQDGVAIREKLVAMGQLAAGVAHELNTPLGNILGYAQLIRDDVDEATPAARYSGIIATETRRCARIVDDLLNYARKDRCDGETCDVNQMVRELIETFINCRLRRYNIRVELDLAPGVLLVEGGCGQLDIVLTNLVHNAIQALDGVPEPCITLQSWTEDAFICLAVEDNGPGVSPDARGRIFDPFFTTKNVGEGSGLGLSICQAIMVRRGGFIAYDADFKSGARFVLRMPEVNLQRVVS